MKKITLEEAINPYFARENTFSLNGEWMFSLTKEGEIPLFDKKINVPFALETPLSGITKSVKADDVMHYLLKIDEDNEFLFNRAILHFEAVDQITKVYFNEELVLEHAGGYWPFSILLPHLRKGDVIRLEVKDDTSSDVFARGKQTLHPGSIWYTATSGIWGSVYVEYLPDGFYFDSLSIEPNFDKKEVIFSLTKDAAGAVINVTSPNGEEITSIVDNDGLSKIDLSNNFYPWSNLTPNLYSVRISKENDVIYSSFGVRKVSKVIKDGKNLICLNDKPILVNALLDQGYYSPESHLTPIRQEDIKKELERVKSFGFNALRKHIKIEPLRWYFECDRLGIIVIQDMVNSGGEIPLLRLALAPFIPFKMNDTNYKLMKRSNPRSREMFKLDVTRTINLLKNSPSILVWTIFNEGWGQFDAVKFTDYVKELDSTRLIDSTSGWFDKKTGDFDSHHIYFRKVRMKNKGDRVLSLSEFGGFKLDTFANKEKKTFGYLNVSSKENLLSLYRKTYLEDILPIIEKEALSVLVLTQWSDVEGEINGLISYDRSINKVEPEKMKEIFDELYKRFEKTWG